MRQYYYRVDECRAANGSEDNCICWHDEGTGPLWRRGSSPLEWRTKPGAPLSAPTEDLQATISRLTADIETLESNARVQAKLLADTGRERDGLKRWREADLESRDIQNATILRLVEALQGARSCLRHTHDRLIEYTAEFESLRSTINAEVRSINAALTTTKSNESGSTTNDVP